MLIYRKRLNGTYFDGATSFKTGVGKLFPYAKLAGSSGPRTILRYCFNLWVFCYFWNSWFALRWPVDVALPHISVLELIPIVWLPVIGANCGRASESFSSAIIVQLCKLCRNIPRGTHIKAFKTYGIFCY